MPERLKHLIAGAVVGMILAGLAGVSDAAIYVSMVVTAAVAATIHRTGPGATDVLARALARRLRP